MHTTSPATAISCQRAASACHRRHADAAAACDRTSWRRHFFSILLAGVKSYYRSKRTCAAHIKRTCAACSCGGARAVRPRHTTPIVHNCASCTIAHRSTLWSAPIVHTLCTHCAHIVRTLWSTAPLSIFFTASVSAGGVAAAASPKEDAPIPASNISFQRVKPSPNNPAEIP